MRDAIEQCDGATGGGPAYYMINCAHPTHFEDELKTGGAWVKRLRGLRANSSSAAMPSSTPRPTSTSAIRWNSAATIAGCGALLPHLTVLGGCCGTDHRHVEQICAACFGTKAAA